MYSNANDSASRACAKKLIGARMQCLEREATLVSDGGRKVRSVCKICCADVVTRKSPAARRGEIYGVGSSPGRGGEYLAEGFRNSNHMRVISGSPPSDLGFTRDRHYTMRTSATADVRWRAGMTNPWM